MSERTTPPAAFSPFDQAEPKQFDPLRLCIYSTIGLLAWLLTPALVVAFFSGIALMAYYKARRAGLVKSRCKLGDTRLVMAYLAVLFLAGSGYTVYRISQLL
ncbi:MAG: hypothetical protein R3258_03515 [Acidimicrobiia bacterium]|nr:hypothetical protein [Acidimicrobiia bacterium]